MKEYPILFSGPMVRAILDGNKTKTRRVIKPQPAPLSHSYVDRFERFDETRWMPTSPSGKVMVFEPGIYRCPYGQAGDHLWVKETWRAEELSDESHDPGLDGIRYRADDTFVSIENTCEASDRWCEVYKPGEKWHPSIFMPRWASRITLEVLDVRVEQVQNISEADCYAEGLGMDPNLPHPRAWFRVLWDSINAKRGYSWDVNPWVWVVEFGGIV